MTEPYRFVIEDPTISPMWKTLMRIFKRSNSARSGLPIYEERIRRAIADPLTEAPDRTEWRPLNTVTAKIWRSLELLRDIEQVLDSASETENLSARRRRMKFILPPLVSLVQELRSLCNNFASSPEWSGFLSSEQRRLVVELNDALQKDVPLGKDSQLRRLRDKLAAHLDKKMLPETARELLEKAEFGTYGRWLHSCISVLAKLLELNLYSWEAGDVSEKEYRFMQREPWVVTVTRDAEGKAKLVGLDVGSSPRQVIADACEAVVAKSQWLFRPGEQRLVVLGPNGSRDS